MCFRRRLGALAFVGCVAAAAVPRPAHAEEASPANVAAARRHFEKARAFYGQGAYRDAITELDAAHTLDPNAKDLVFNLGVVHEKLADIDEALKWFRLYTTMDLVPQERDKAEAYIKRLEGAKHEIETKQTTPSPSEPSPATEEPGAQPPAQAPPGRGQPGPPRTGTLPPPQQPAATVGRIDGFTIGAAGLTAVSLGFGIVMAVKAKRDRPADNLVTPRDEPYSELASMTDQAYREAVLADVGFGAALVCGVATAYLYLGRSRTILTPPARTTSVSAGPTAGGGALFLKGSF